MKASVKSSGSHEEIIESIKAFMKMQALVGIPEDKSNRKNEGLDTEKINNAQLMYIHTNGSPARNIPPRPVIEPALEAKKEVLSELYKNAVDKALVGDNLGAKQELKKLGTQGANFAKGWFEDQNNNWAPNSDVTIYGTKASKDGKKFIKGKKKKKQDNNFNPLIDTGQLRKSITYVLKEE